MSLHLERAALLFQQSRYDLAEQELSRAIGAEPDNPTAHALLALCHSRRQRHGEAVQAGERAVALDPGLSFAHSALAEALYQAEWPNAAERAIDTAIELDPTRANSFALKAAVRFALRDWPGALGAAEQGLALDPEHDGCTNLRAMALVKLGRKQQAGATIAGALARDPESALSHANQGWTLLEQSRPAEALEHFREALRINPELDWARAGVVEALKARYLVYRVVLRFFLWMAKLSASAQWAVIIGILLLQRVLRQVARANPELALVVKPVLYAVFGFVVLSWVADPLFNLLLRLNRFGRLALDRERVVASNWVGGCALLALAALGWAVASGSDAAWAAALVSALMIMPVAGVFNVPSGGKRFALTVYALVLAFLGFGSAYLLWADQGAAPARRLGDDAGLMLGLFLLGTFAFGFVVNLMVSARPRG